MVFAGHISQLGAHMVSSAHRCLSQYAWLKAAKQPEGLRLRFKTKQGLYEARRHLYEVAREAKTNYEDFPELAQAAEDIQLTLDGELGLWMRHRATNDASQGLEAALKGSE